MHNQLIRFPDIAFFVSPIPLHIAAMVILYGHMSRCDRIPRQIALEDVWMALDMLPSFRWRWEHKDVNSGHPLIAKLAEKVLDVNLHQVAPTSAPMLLSEQDWDSEHILSPKPGANLPPGQSPTTPKMGPAQYAVPPPMFGPHPPMQIKGSPNSHSNGDANGATPKMPEVPPFYFYPFYGAENGAAGGNGVVPPGINAYGYQADQGQYMLEEKETTTSPTVNTMQIQAWQQNGVSPSSSPGPGSGPKRGCLVS